MKILKNVYVVLTEYQFLQAVNIATSVNKEKTFQNIIYVIKNGTRLNGLHDNKKLNTNRFHIQILEKESPKYFVQKVLEENADHFFFFQGNSAINVYLGKVLSRRGAQISLGPDGYSAYNQFNKKHELLSVVKDSIQKNIYLIRNKLFKGIPLVFNHYKYGNHRFIDQIWLTHPEKYNHKTNNNVSIVKLPDFNEDCLLKIKEYFKFEDTFPTSDIIYYFNQPLWNQELIEEEFKFLKETLVCFNNKTIVLKLHPLTSKKVLRSYQELQGLKIITASVPAEVMLSQLKNCIVFTGWSTVLITENKSCNYYFNYPIYLKCNTKLFNQSNIVLLDHINLIEKPQEMKFPNE